MKSIASLMRPTLQAMIVVLAVFGGLGRASHAQGNPQCLDSAIGALCQVLLTNVDSHPNSVVIHWLTQGVTPDRVALAMGGTAARLFSDATILQSENKAGPLGGFANYMFTVSGLAAGSTLNNLHLLAIWGDKELASNQFSASTSPPDDRSPPVIVGSGFENDMLHVAWTSKRNWPRYNVRWELDRLDDKAQNHDAPGGLNSAFAVHAQNRPGAYFFIVEGCESQLLHHSICSGWSAPMKVVATVGAPKVVRYSWGHLTAGDCQMQNAWVEFRSNGTATFSAEVKTNPKHNGNTWHATLSAQTASGQTLFTMGAFDSPRMSDKHDWYQWSQIFAYDSARFGQIGKANLKNHC